MKSGLNTVKRIRGKRVNNPCANCLIKEECSNIDQEMSCEEVKERVKREKQERRREEARQNNKS